MITVSNPLDSVVVIKYIFAFIIGLLIGNFTTTILYRLPRNIKISGFNKNFTEPPFCAWCRHRLKFYEYLPFLSWFSTLGKCNYCKHPIPYSYTILEILGGFLSLLCIYLFNDFTDLYILIFGFGAISFLAIFIYLEHKNIPPIIIAVMVFWGAIYRTLIEQNLEWITSLSVAFILSLLLLKNDEFFNAEKLIFINILLPASVWCSIENLALYSAVVLIYYLLRLVGWKSLNIYCLSIITLLLIVFVQGILIQGNAEILGYSC